MRLGCLLAVLLGACGGGGSDPPASPEPLQGAPVLVAAGGEVAGPTPWDGTGVDLAPLGIAPEEIDGAFRFTTPPSTLFRFEVLTTGGSGLAIAHPAGGTDTVELTKARLFYATPGGGNYASPIGGIAETPWFEATQDDIARIEIGGSIVAPQVVVVRAGANYALVFLDLGPPSAIVPPATTADDATPVEDVVLASGFRDGFGSPAVAALAGTPAVTWLAGDDAVQTDTATYHVRARVEAPPPAGSAPAYGTGHAAAGVGQHLLIARAEGFAVTIEYSASAGSTFDPPLTIHGPDVTRHPVLAADASGFALAFWRGLDLVLVRGEFPPLFLASEEILFTAPEGSLPLRPAVAAAGDDVAVAYAFARADLDAALRPLDVSTEFRCFVRAPGRPDVDLPVARLADVSRGPGVAIAGDGSILCAVDGIRVFERPAGGDFSLRESVGAPGAHSPRALVRGARLDVCYLQPTARGTEVHRASWADLASGAPAVRRLTVATRAWRTNGPPSAYAWPVYHPQNEPVPWIGYDGFEVRGLDAASDDAGNLTLAIHAEHTDRFFFILRDPAREVRFIGGGLGPPPPVRVPLPTEPALTGSLSEPYDLDRHKLRVLRFGD
jgi:hypothetical protein